MQIRENITRRSKLNLLGNYVSSQALILFKASKFLSV